VDDKGVLYWTDSNKCEGEWKNDKINKEGVGHHYNGDKYNRE